MNEWLLKNLVCPRDKLDLKFVENYLTCRNAHSYPVIDGVPVMLLEEIEPNHHYITETLQSVKGNNFRSLVDDLGFGSDEIDPFVQHEIPHTCGTLYFPLQYNLVRYPIPELRLPRGSSERFLDVGCNWGRWTIAAALKNYRPVGIDPSLKAIFAARNVARQLGVEADYVAADARHLPFADNCFDIAFSALVLQSFSKENARISLREISRTIKEGGKTLIQMPNKYGVRSFYQHVRGRFRETEYFDVRYWSPKELMECFVSNFGETTMTADCFFGLGIQKNDIDMLPVRFKAIVRLSELLRSISKRLPFIVNVADSVYLESVNQKPSEK